MLACLIDSSRVAPTFYRRGKTTSFLVVIFGISRAAEIDIDDICQDTRLNSQCFASATPPDLSTIFNMDRGQKPLGTLNYEELVSMFKVDAIRIEPNYNIYISWSMFHSSSATPIRPF